MRTKLLCLMLFATSCASNVLHAPSSLESDPLVDVVAIPPGQCTGLDDHFAISTRGVRALLLSIRERETKAAIGIAACDGARRIVEARAMAAEKAQEQASWWARWGLPIGFASGIAATAALTAFVIGVSK